MTPLPAAMNQTEKAILKAIFLLLCCFIHLKSADGRTFALLPLAPSHPFGGVGDSWKTTRSSVSRLNALGEGLHPAVCQDSEV